MGAHDKNDLCRSRVKRDDSPVMFVIDFSQTHAKRREMMAKHTSPISDIQLIPLAHRFDPQFNREARPEQVEGPR